MGIVPKNADSGSDMDVVKTTPPDSEGSVVPAWLSARRARLPHVKTAASEREINADLPELRSEPSASIESERTPSATDSFFLPVFSWFVVCFYSNVSSQKQSVLVF